MDLLEDIKMSLLNFNFVMIYIIHKMLLLLKNHMNYLRNSTFECNFFFKKKHFSKHEMIGNLRPEKENS